MTRCAVCHARVDINAAPEHPQHIWHTYWSDAPLCRTCFRGESATRLVTGDWPAFTTTDPGEVTYNWTAS